MKKLILLGLPLLLAQPVQAADVYKCIGENGRTRYQPTACEGGEIVPIDEAQPAPAHTPSFSTASSYTPAHRPIVRSEAQKDLFKFINPCPSTGETSGPCPGYVIDHVKPLACGGADDPRNMQWQTVAAGKAKDRWERDGCQTRRASYRFEPYRSSAGTQVYTGPRGGRYILGTSGRKHYLGRPGS